jgi:hypothetical protein
MMALTGYTGYTRYTGSNIGRYTSRNAAFILLGAPF